MLIIKKHSPVFLVVLSLLAALPAFAIDTYTPAVTIMGHFFGVSPTKVIVTISSYMLGFAIGMLVWGPLSDIFGRKIIIKIGLVIYLIATIAASLSQQLNVLVAARFFQSIGDSAGVGIAFTMMRDCYSGDRLTRNIAAIIAMMMLAPMIAPIIGSLLLRHQHWQNIFHFLFGYGFIMFLISFALPETLNPKLRLRFDSVINQFVGHLSNTIFLRLMFSAAMSFAATFCFISSAAIVYMTIYGLGKYLYAGLFALNAIAIIFGSLTLRYYTGRISPRVIQSIGLTVFVVSDLLLLVITHYHPNNWKLFTPLITCTSFGLCLLIGSFISSAINSVDNAFGTATAILNFTRNCLASLSSYFISLMILHSVIPILLMQLLFAVLLIIFLTVITSRERTLLIK